MCVLERGLGSLVSPFFQFSAESFHSCLSAFLSVSKQFAV